MNYRAASFAVSGDEMSLKGVTPRMFLSGVQFRIHLDSRLKHAGMTDFGSAINVTQQAEVNRSPEIEIAKGPRS